MGFIFDEFELDKKVYVNLSDSALLTIQQDMDNFYADDVKNKAGFLNKVFSNFYPLANASINLRCLEKKQKLLELLETPEFEKIDVNSRKLFINKLIDNYKGELLLEARAYAKGKPVTFRINVKNVEALNESIDEDKNYDGNLGLYLKAIYEEYARKSNYEREQIFFMETIDKINEAMSSGKKLKLSLKRKLYTKTSTSYNRKFLVTPYKIVQDTTNTFNYLVGFSEEILDNGEIGKKSISSFRISRINTITDMKSMKGFISAANKASIETELVKKTPQFMAGELVDVKVRLTKKGVESFQRQLYMKPTFYEVLDNENNIYLFHCTEVQAINYFFKFARDIEVLEPASLREKFISRYEEALKNYDEVIIENKNTTEE